MIDREAYRFGSAAFATEAEIEAAGLFTYTPDAVYAGLFEGARGLRVIWYKGMGGILLTAGARAGKLRDILLMSVCAGALRSQNLVCLDVKGELAYQAQDQTADRKHALHWNPSGQHGLPQTRINPLGFLKRESPYLVEDAKEYCLNAIPADGNAQGAYFKDNARIILEAMCLTAAMIDGMVTFPRLYAAVNGLVMNDDAALDFQFEMSESPFELCQRVSSQIDVGREDGSGGWKGIVGELQRSVAALSSPQIMDSVSPHADGTYDFDMDNLLKDKRRYQLYLMPEVSQLQAAAPILKAFFVGAFTQRARCSNAPKQTWILDEVSQLGTYPLVPKLFSLGAGLGIRPFAVYQSSAQLKRTGLHAEVEIPSSAQLQISFAVRDLETATALSKACGVESRAYDDVPAQLRAAHERDKAFTDVMFGGADPFAAAAQYDLHDDLAQHRTLQQRSLLYPDEILGLPTNAALIRTDGVPGPIYAARRPFWDMPFMGGRYHPSPFHPPLNRVRVAQKSWRGLHHRWRRVLRRPVEKQFADYPQYADGTRSRVQ